MTAGAAPGGKTAAAIRITNSVGNLRIASTARITAVSI